MQFQHSRAAWPERLNELIMYPGEVACQNNLYKTIGLTCWATLLWLALRSDVDLMFAVVFLLTFASFILSRRRESISPFDVVVIRRECGILYSYPCSNAGRERLFDGLKLSYPKNMWERGCVEVRQCRTRVSWPAFQAGNLKIITGIASISVIHQYDLNFILFNFLRSWIHWIALHAC